MLTKKWPFWITREFFSKFVHFLKEIKSKYGFAIIFTSKHNVNKISRIGIVNFRPNYLVKRDFKTF